MKDTRYRWVAEAFALVLPSVVVCAPVLFTPRCLDGREFRSYLRSHAVYAREMSQRDGEWPRWNGRQWTGTPFLGDLHDSFHYPPNLLYLTLAPERAYGYLFLFHMLVASVGMYRLSRYFEFRRSAGVLGAIAYSVSLSVAAHMDAGMLGHYVAPALAPWGLLLILRMVKRASMVRIVLLSVVVGAVVVGGSPEDFPFLILMGAGLLYWTSVDAARRKRPWRKSSVVVIALSVLLGLALAALSVLPAIEVARRASPPPGPALIALDWRVLYIGVLPTVVAAFPFQSPKRGPALFCAFSGIAAILPGLLMPKLAVCALWAVPLALAILAAMGWDGLVRGRYAPRTVAWIVMVQGGFAVIAAALWIWRTGRYGEPSILLGLLGVTAILVTRLHTLPMAPIAAFILAAGDLCFFDMRVIQTVPPEDYAAAPWYDSLIGPERRDYRLLDLTSNDASPMAFGFRLSIGHGYPQVGKRPSTDGEAMDANALWLISSDPPPNPAWWKEIGRRDGRVLYRALGARRTAYLPAPEDGLQPPLKITKAANSIEIGGRTYEPAKLIVCESWMPGWKAYLQRREIPVTRGQDHFMAIDVPAGDWYVTLRYQPEDYRLGRLISTSAAAALAGLLIAGMKRSKIAIS